jgi:predicted small metal-binding protein
MENQKNKINVFESQRPELSREKKDDLWSAIENDIKNSPVPSPFLFNFINQKRMITAFAALVLMFGVGGTVYASNEARPGDLLFPIDQAIEEIRLAVVGNDDDRARLQIQFAEERLAELRSILEEDDFSNSDANSDDSYSTSTISNFEAEADVFLDTTIVKVEINDRKTTFETNAKTKEEIVNEIVSKFSLERTLVEQVLDMEVEDRVSRVEDVVKKTISSSDDDRITKALNLIDDSVSTSNINDSERSRIITSLLRELTYSFDRIEIEEDRIEIRDGKERIEIREKDGETEIRIKDRDDEYEDLDNSSDDSSSQTSFEAEADVFLDTTIVKVEINDRKTTFETNAKTKEEIVNEIVSKFSLERTLVEQVLGMEVEDRVSRMEDDRDEDLEDDRDDDSNEDDSDDSENDEEDDSDFDNESEDGDIKIEVRVEDGKAEVKMEYDNKEDEFNFSYSDRDGLISELARRSSLSKTIIEENLDLEIRD